MDKITELTANQTAMMKEFVDKYTAISFQTGKINRENASKYAEKLYKLFNKPSPTTIIVSGPIQAWITTMLLEMTTDMTKIPKSAKKSFTKPVICDAISNILEQLDEKSRKTIANKIKKIERAFGDEIDFDFTRFSLPYLDGQFLAYYIAWVKYFEAIGVKITIDYSIIEDQLQFGPVWPLNEFCIISERIKECNVKNNGIHKEGGPAVEFYDGTRVWALNGVRVPQWLAESKWNEIDCNEFAKITNAEVRREFVRKVGVERLCTQLGTKVLDKQGDYELHEIDLLGATGKWPYLKMLNPSIGVWHMECVGKECKTVNEALTWRNQSDSRPEVLT